MTLTGQKSLKVKQATTFGLSIINGSASPCWVAVASWNFELKIYSGTDRIWSTKDCARAVTGRTATLAPEKAVEWIMSWDGHRSRAQCKQRPEIPRPGTYFATAQLKGADPVQLRMTLRG